MEIYRKLSNIQTALKVPKQQNNNFGKYKYRSCEDILEVLKPLLKENNSVLYISDEISFINSRYYVKATAHFIDMETGEQITNTAFAREEELKKGMDQCQITGASSSYARKYALNGLFGIDDTKDSDCTNDKGDGKAADKAIIEESGKPKEVNSNDKGDGKPVDKPAGKAIIEESSKPKEVDSKDNNIKTIEICECCGETIKPDKKRTLESIIQNSTELYGKKMCIACCVNEHKKRKEEANSNKKEMQIYNFN